MQEESHTLVLTKLAERALQAPVIQKNVDRLLAGANSRSLIVQGWSIEADPDSADYPEWEDQVPWRQFNVYEGTAIYKYELYLKVVYSTRSDKVANKQVFQAICRSIHTKAAQNPVGKWTLATVDGDEYFPPDENAVPLANEFVGYTEVNLPDDFDDRFQHLFGLEHHVARIRRALEAGELSMWNQRFHCALIGPPGCGKSDICQTIKRILGEESVLEFDATATTAAGAIKELAERDILPRVLLVEEIEKADEKALTFLLAVADLRAEIRKTTARATIQRDTKLFVIATVNNVELFNKLNAGALASRFANKIFFRRPSRDQLELILQREISKVEGDFAWISPALDYCEKQDITDPRTAIAIALCGREQLITGEYQEMMEITSEDLPTSFGNWDSNW